MEKPGSFAGLFAFESIMRRLGDLKGQKIAVQLLNAYLRGQTPPLMIFHGPEGTGKWTAAEIFIQQKLCEVQTGCGSCSSCRKIQRGEHPDFIQFPPTGTAIGDPDNPEEFTIRWLLRTRLRYSPFAGNFRFVLFPRADLIQHEAETALLKTLEEPPDHTRFIFITSSLDNLKPTIISRGVCLPFQLLPFAQLKTIAGIHDEYRDLLGGSLRLAPLLSQDLFVRLQEKIEGALTHPLALLELERFLRDGERKNFANLLEEESYTYPELLDFFGLLFCKAAEGREEKFALWNAIFEFKKELHRDISGLHAYLLGLLFHRLARILFAPRERA